MNKQDFVIEMKKLGIELSDIQLNKFEKYYEILIDWNNKINLTGIIKKEDVYLKHFYDSSTLVKVIDFEEEQTLCDVGSGAGFPGIVIKILYPNLKVTLIDSLMKRIKFLKEVINELELKNINVVHSRIEDFGKLNRETFDVVTARAVAPLNILLEYCIPIVKVNKYFISMKGNISREINLSKKSLQILNSKILNVCEFNLPIENSLRNLILIQKQEKTSIIYPRKIDKIKKQPL